MALEFVGEAAEEGSAQPIGGAQSFPKGKPMENRKSVYQEGAPMRAETGTSDHNKNADQSLS